jgi:hypothetical protein
MIAEWHWAGTSALVTPQHRRSFLDSGRHSTVYVSSTYLILPYSCIITYRFPGLAQGKFFSFRYFFTFLFFVRRSILPTTLAVLSILNSILSDLCTLVDLLLLPYLTPHIIIA